MSAPSGGATSAPQCACTNISIMQLFHELKQQFPGIPDHVVSNTISSHCHDRLACRSRLECEAKNYISHLYPSSSLSAAKKEVRDNILFPQQCPNQLLITKESNKANNIQVSSVFPQKALCSFSKHLDENENESIVKSHNEECDNLDKNNHIPECEFLDVSSSENVCKNNKSPESLYVKNEKCNQKDENANDCTSCALDSKCYRILKSNKVISDLNKKLTEQNLKHDSRGNNLDSRVNIDNETSGSHKLKRPTTLHFSTDPHFSGFHNTPQPETHQDAKHIDTNQDNSCKCQQAKQKSDDKTVPESHANDKDSYGGLHQRDESSYPLNVSVNLNCRMDVHPSTNRSQQDPWMRNYSSPGNITSVNLTVCTPTGPPHGSEDKGSGGSPASGRGRNFEGRVQITVSPASGQPLHPYRSHTHSRPFYSPISQMMPETPPISPLDDLVRRQKARLSRLKSALAGERGRLASMQREVSVLRGPVPSAARLRPTVHHLRHLCQRLTRHLDRATANADGEFYDNIYTGQHQTGVPPGQNQDRGQSQRRAEESGGSWQCHVCTFRNNAFLNKCEQCDMPRIILGTPVTHTSPNVMDSLISTMDKQASIVTDSQLHAS